jgi:hypothetical protein
VSILIDAANVIIAGHGQVLAAEQLGIVDVPVVALAAGRKKQKRAYRPADNELAMHTTPPAARYARVVASPTRSSSGSSASLP